MPVAKKSRSSSKNAANDADNAAAAMVDRLSSRSVLERREAQPWRDRADVEFVALPDIDQQLAALTLQDADVNSKI
jgi:hypothetical protein